MLNDSMFIYLYRRQFETILIDRRSGTALKTIQSGLLFILPNWEIWLDWSLTSLGNIWVGSVSIDGLSFSKNMSDTQLCSALNSNIGTYKFNFETSMSGTYLTSAHYKVHINETKG